MPQHALLNGHVRPIRLESPPISADLERRCFEFDRDSVLQQIERLRNIIDNHAEDLGMVAFEGVFEKPLAAGILRTSRSLRTLSKELIALRTMLSEANGYPKPEKK